MRLKLLSLRYARASVVQGVDDPALGDGGYHQPVLLMPKRKQVKALHSRPLSDGKLPRLACTPVTYTTMAPGKVEILDLPAKSASDKKNYRVIRLENGLSVLLISDETYPLDKLDEEEKEEVEDEMDVEEEDDVDEDEDEEDSEDCDEEEDDDEAGEGGPPAKKVVQSTGLKMSAAALCVHMGSFSDPEDVPGLAHFLEHMVFMGSGKFPDENGFDSFIAKQGGYDNASTDTETTVFYFESPRRHFHEGLDRFAQFFIDPLMKKEAMQREREAVDSEFQMALPSDDNRVAQVFGGLARPGHPMTKFMWGNLASLSPEGMTDEALHARLHEFRKRHYTAVRQQFSVLTLAS